jgi:hypothetical protein
VVRDQVPVPLGPNWHRCANLPPCVGVDTKPPGLAVC